MKPILAICLFVVVSQTSVSGTIRIGDTVLDSASCPIDGGKEQKRARVLFEATDSTSTSENSGIPEHLSITYQLVGKKIANKQTIEVVFKAHLTHHSTIMYSSDSLCAFGPMPATVTITGEGYEQIGPLVSLNTKDHSDEFFECDYKYFEDDIEMIQQVKIKDKTKPLQMTLAYQLCNDEKGFCLNLEHAITVDLLKKQQ